jgi:polysaccharide export outer membrane protein
MRHLVVLLSLFAVVASPVCGQTSGGRSTSAEVRIKLPDGALPDLSVEPDRRRIVVELPRGASFPIDFQASSGGLIRDSTVEPLGSDRVRLELDLAAGYLARISLESGELVLTFVSRVGSTIGVVHADDQYLLGAKDKVMLTVHNRPELSTVLTISREGTVTVALIGEVEAAGISPTELENRIAEQLGRSYLVDPKVDVAVEEYNSQWVMVTGEVPLSGRVPLRGGTHLKEVLSEAGGFRETGGQEIVISRRIEDSEEFETITVNRKEFESGVSNPLIRHGDIVDVSKALYCYIHGEVRSPGRVPCEQEITLLKAITMVGGLTQWADRKSVRILHGHDPDSDEVVVNLKRIQDGRAPDPLLKGGEVVVVKRRFF